MYFYRKNLKIKDDLWSKVYGDVTLDDLILRDHLAIDRTILSTENTFLAYIRTSVTMMAAGVTLMHFSTTLFMKIIGFLCIVASIFLLVFGFKRTSRLKNKIYSSLKKNSDLALPSKNAIPIVSPLDQQILRKKAAKIKVLPVDVDQ